MYVRPSASVPVILSACIIVPPTESICVEINTGDFCGSIVCLEISNLNNMAQKCLAVYVKT
jgi:hypothetical protein